MCSAIPAPSMTTFPPVQAQSAFSQAQIAGMSSKPKRKRSFEMEAEEEDIVEATKHVRTLPPSVEGPGGFAFPINMPELVADASTSASASDVMDHDMDFEMDDGEPVAPREGHYSYSEGGSGGFMFGPGADEDEMSDDSSSSKGYPTMDIYPSLQKSANPHHFSNNPPYTSFSASAPSTPWSAQPYASNLSPPPSSTNVSTPGLMQPPVATPLDENATVVERARGQHGPQCTSIPKLRMSDYPDASGERSLWAYCADCGAMERAS